MKTINIFKSISYLLVVILISLNSITTTSAQGGNGGGSGGSGGSSSTGGDYSGSSYTGNSATGGENSGSQDGSGQSGYPRGGGDQLQNTYGELYQLKARISNESLEKGNELFTGVKNQLNTQNQTNEEKLNYYQNQIQNLNNFDYGYMNEEDRTQAKEYLKTRLEYKVGIHEEIGNIEENMSENALEVTKTFLNDYKNRYQYTSDLNQKYQYERLLSISTKIQSKIGDIDTTEENRERIQNILKYMEMSMYDKIDDMEN